LFARNARVRKPSAACQNFTPTVMENQLPVVPEAALAVVPGAAPIVAGLVVPAEINLDGLIK
jgi:hypothetical protein